MTIELLRYPEGALLDQNKPLMDSVGAYVKQDIDDFETLPADEYNITPPAWENPEFHYNLLVLPNGDGALRQIPTDEESGWVRMRKGKQIGEIKPGGRVTHLPQDAKIVPIVGPIKDDSRLLLHAVVVHLPGPSPTEYANAYS